MLIAQLILDGKRNDEIFYFIKEHMIDSKFAHPVTTKAIGDIRYRLKTDGIPERRRNNDENFPVEK